MCANCVTGLDAAAFQLAGLAAAAGAGWRRLNQRADGVSGPRRRLVAYERDARFLQSLDLDPLAVLGPPPEAAGNVTVARS